MEASEFLRKFAHEVGASIPTDDEIESLLALAGVAAHASERKAAPIACWLAARAGQSPADALAVARRLVEQTPGSADRPRPSPSE